MTEEKNEGPRIDQTNESTAASQANEHNAESETDANVRPSGKRKRGWMVFGIVVGVLLIAFAAFWVWHEQPSFCNAICHSPMDNYVETYYSEDPGMMASVHENAGVNCLGCHNPEMTEQVSEVCAWVADDYPLYENGNLADENAQNMASEEFCTNSGCHNMNDVVANTWGFAGNDAKYNPHSSHQDGSIQCGDCHKSHTTSTLYCAKCHSLNLPEGWEATSE